MFHHHQLVLIHQVVSALPVMNVSLDFAKIMYVHKHVLVSVVVIKMVVSA